MVNRFGKIAKDKRFLLSVVTISFLTLVALVGPSVLNMAGLDAEKVDLLARFSNPSFSHPLGTDDLGRDVLSRIAQGARVSLLFSMLLTVCAIVCGTVLGLISGYYRGAWDFIIMRISDAFLSLPTLPLMVVFSAVDLNKMTDLLKLDPSAGSFIKIFVVILMFSWMRITRLIRADVLTIKNSEFVAASRSQGASDMHIIFRHILPNTLTPILTSASLVLSSTILYESTLSFLGLGIKPPTPSWGNMLSNSLEFIHSSAWLAVFPGLMIFLAVLGLNGICNGIKRNFASR